MTDTKTELLNMLKKPDWLGYALMQETARLYIQNLSPAQSDELYKRVQLTYQKHADNQNIAEI